MKITVKGKTYELQLEVCPDREIIAYIGTTGYAVMGSTLDEVVQRAAEKIRESTRIIVELGY